MLVVGGELTPELQNLCSREVMVGFIGCDLNQQLGKG